MSASYGWTPASPPPPPEGGFQSGLAAMLARRYLDSTDYGQLDGLVLSERAALWLQGVADAFAVSGDDRASEVSTEARELAEAIAKHKKIRLVVTR